MFPYLPNFNPHNLKPANFVCGPHQLIVNIRRSSKQSSNGRCRFLQSKVGGLHFCTDIHYSTYLGIETHRHADGQTNKQADQQTDTVHRGRQPESRQTGGKADRLADRKTDVQKEGQLDRHILKYLPVLTVWQLFMQAGRWVGRQEGRQENRVAVRRADRQAGRQEGMQKGKNAGRQTDRQTEVQEDRRTDIHRHTDNGQCKNTGTG